MTKICDIFCVGISVFLIGGVIAAQTQALAAERQSVAVMAQFADGLVIDNDWIAVDLGPFLPNAINNATQIAGNIIAEKGGPFAGVWKQGFAERLDGGVVTSESSAIAINAAGQVAGYQKNRYGDGRECAVVWNNGIASELGVLNGTESRALALNDSGEVVGLVKSGRGQNAFIWRSGNMQYLGELSAAIAINSSGQVLGTVEESNPLLWNKGLIQMLAAPGDQEFTQLGAKRELTDKTLKEDAEKQQYLPDISAERRIADSWKPAQVISANSETRIGLSKKTRITPVRLNDDGMVAGYTPTGTFLWKDGEFHQFSLRLVPMGLNKFGMLSGSIDNRAAVWYRGHLTELNGYFKKLRGWRRTEARGINDLGQIIVYATNGIPLESRGFLLTPKSNVPTLIKGAEYTTSGPFYLPIAESEKFKRIKSGRDKKGPEVDKP